ncbi:alpha/beta hydrolase [Alkalicoccus daliensis]|uniref:Esterase/lipase n=1 Tax=Alkalicoccus daliensis TaxID=745820 RepID=A0A1H0JBW4_9BACI|nr:alpha/beta fold hydrolase [Alkalicoccus daliensis]SDO40959.1 Esterase/lipase [Alkalicoccus daliensis]
MIGCLIIHGFTGTPQEVKDIEAQFKEKNWLVYTPELPGHDGSRNSMKEVKYKEWVYKAQVALEEMMKRCEKVYVIGFSMGGVIAGYLAAKYPVDKLVLISSAVYYLNPKQIAEDVKGWVMEGIRGELDQNEIYHFYRDKIKRTPVAATIEFAKLVRKLRHALEDITVPTLIVQGEKDGLVPIKSAEYIYEHIRSEDKHIYLFENAKHYIWFGEEKDALLERLDYFLSNTEQEDGGTAKRSRKENDENSATETIYF